VLGFVAAAVLIAGHAHAQSVTPADACADASEKGQLLKIKGMLRAARAEFLTCVKDACPPLVRKDCGQFLVDLESAIPTVVLGARDPNGSDLTEVRVLVDAETIAEHLDGKAIPMDPGVHKFRFEAKGRVAVEQTIVVREGERNRVVAVTLKSDAPDGGTPIEKPGPPVSAWVAAGVGFVGLGTFAVLGLSARAEFNDLENRCGSRCPDDDVDRVRRKALFADIGLGVGLIGAGIATYLFVDHARKPVRPVLGAGFFGIVATF
jgi:hypothetical protein